MNRTEKVIIRAGFDLAWFLFFYITSHMNLYVYMVPVWLISYFVLGWIRSWWLDDNRDPV